MWEALKTVRNIYKIVQIGIGVLALLWLGLGAMLGLGSAAVDQAGDEVIAELEQGAAMHAMEYAGSNNSTARARAAAAEARVAALVAAEASNASAVSDDRYLEPTDDWGSN